MTTRIDVSKKKAMLTINKSRIGNHHPTYIIAEIGINHNGSVDTAMAMMDEAVQCGVDAVKFQIITADASYAKGTKSYEIFKKLEFTSEQWHRIVSHATNLKVDIFSTFVNPFDLAYVEKFDFPAIKISSTNINNFPLLEAVARLDKPVLISTGMAFMSEVDEAVRYLEENGQKQIAILQCTSLYPTPPQQTNLLAIKTLARSFPSYPIGFSDHTLGENCALAAVALGAKIIEKHFTLSHQLEGPDHHYSANPREFTAMVKSIREVELALGRYEKKPVPQELKGRAQLQRSLVAADSMEPGAVLSRDTIAVKRSAIAGISPKHMDIVRGRILKNAIAKDAPITWNDI